MTTPSSHEQRVAGKDGQVGVVGTAGFVSAAAVPTKKDVTFHLKFLPL